MPCFFQHSRAGRKAEHHIAPAAVNGAADHLDLAARGIRLERSDLHVADVIDLDVIDAP